MVVAGWLISTFARFPELFGSLNDAAEAVGGVAVELDRLADLVREQWSGQSVGFDHEMLISGSAPEEPDSIQRGSRGLVALIATTSHLAVHYPETFTSSWRWQGQPVCTGPA